MHIKKENLVQPVNNKLLILLLLLLVTGQEILAQKKYFFLDSIPDGYHTTHYTLSTKELYKVDKTIDLFNILYLEGALVKYSNDRRDSLFADKNLILFSALPALDNRKDWVEINPDSIRTRTVDIIDLIHLFRKITLTDYQVKYERKTKFFNEYQLVVNRNGKYYTPANCLLQFYAIRNRNEIFNQMFGTINMKQTPRTIVDVAKIFKQQFILSEFPLYMFRTASSISFFDNIRDRREFLSKKIHFENKDTLYKFWTFTGWYESQSLFEIDRGVDRFIYLPGQGIVGGSFDFFFYHYRNKIGLSNKDFIDRINEESIMLDERIAEAYHLKNM